MNAPKAGDLLLVEDNPEDLELTLRALRKANLSHCVQVCRDGAEAVDYVFAQGTYSDRDVASVPKVILLDLKLPKLDGLEVLRRLRGDPRTKTTPVVVLTSSKEQRDVVESYRLGVNSYIVKPVNFEGFSNAIRDLGLYWLLLNLPPEAAE